MKNLAQFKERIKSALASGETFTFARYNRQQFLNHPFRDRYPDGIKETTEVFEDQKFGRIQSNSFTRMTEKGESWCEFGKASEWQFSENSATWKIVNDYGDQWKEVMTLTYTFK